MISFSIQFFYEAAILISDIFNAVVAHYSEWSFFVYVFNNKMIIF